MIERFGILVGMGVCNARCRHCAGARHRNSSPGEDGVVDEKRIREVMLVNPVKHVSISGSGEPLMSPLSVERVIRIVCEYGSPGVNLYTNGILVGDNLIRLMRWKGMGLTQVNLTVHHWDGVKNARALGVGLVPDTSTTIAALLAIGLRVKACVPLGCVRTSADLGALVGRLGKWGATSVSCWPMRDPNTDEVDYNLCPASELASMKALETETVRVMWPDDPYQDGTKMTLFPDGRLSARWC